MSKFDVGDIVTRVDYGRTSAILFITEVDGEVVYGISEPLRLPGEDHLAAPTMPTAQEAADLLRSGLEGRVRASRDVTLAKEASLRRYVRPIHVTLNPKQYIDLCDALGVEPGSDSNGHTHDLRFVDEAED